MVGLGCSGKPRVLGTRLLPSLLSFRCFAHPIWGRLKPLK